MQVERDKIIKFIMDSRLVEECIKYQTIKAPKYYVEELTQECWLWLLTYDIEKLNDAYENKHLNALITRWLQNQFYSKTSPFYKRYVRWDNAEVELKSIGDMPDE